MNIQDVAKVEEYPEDLIGAIFSRQRELMEKYHGIEARNGLLQSKDVPVDPHCRFGQARIKDMAWRMTEEFTEATDAKHDREHYLEELIDGLHFLVELMILGDYQPEGSLQGWFENFQNEAVLQEAGPTTPYHVIERIGCACNTLKNKPWKSSHMLTDVAKFRRHLMEAWAAFVRLMIAEGLTPEAVYDLYFRKSSVNAFRIRSNY